MSHITLPRAVVEQVREAFTHVVCVYQDEKDMAALAAINAALAEPEHIHTCGPDCQKPLCVNRLREIAAAVEAEREAVLALIEAYKVPVGNSAAGEMACEWTMDALRDLRDAIRARGSK